MKHKNNVKCIVAMAVIMIISLCACSSDKDNVWTTEVSSTLYSQQDISGAIDVVKSDFKQNNSDFILEKLYYAGDETSQSYQEWADRNNADEVLVLRSAFHTDSDGGSDKSFEPDTEYTDWNWILVRNDGGKWAIADQGF